MFSLLSTHSLPVSHPAVPNLARSAPLLCCYHLSSGLLASDRASTSRRSCIASTALCRHVCCIEALGQHSTESSRRRRRRRRRCRTSREEEELQDQQTRQLERLRCRWAGGSCGRQAAAVARRRRVRFTGAVAMRRRPGGPVRGRMERPGPRLGSGPPPDCGPFARAAPAPETAQCALHSERVPRVTSL